MRPGCRYPGSCPCRGLPVAGVSSPQRYHANQKSASKTTRGPDTKTDGKRDTRRAHQPLLDPPAHRCLEKPREGLWPPRAPPHPNAPSHANAHCGREPPAAHTRPPAPSRRLASPPRLLQSPAAASRMMPGLARAPGRRNAASRITGTRGS